MNVELDFRKRLWLEGYNPIVLLWTMKSKKRYFAYVEMTREEYTHLSREPSSFKGLNKHGKVIVHGEGIPSAETRLFMERHYEFDHTSIDFDRLEIAECSDA